MRPRALRDSSACRTPGPWLVVPVPRDAGHHGGRACARASGHAVHGRSRCAFTGTQPLEQRSRRLRSWKRSGKRSRRPRPPERSTRGLMPPRRSTAGYCGRCSHRPGHPRTAHREQPAPGTADRGTPAELWTNSPVHRRHLPEPGSPSARREPKRAEVKTVKVRNSVDVMAELEALRKRATSALRSRRPSGRDGRSRFATPETRHQPHPPSPASVRRPLSDQIRSGYTIVRGWPGGGHRHAESASRSG